MSNTTSGQRARKGLRRAVALAVAVPVAAGVALVAAAPAQAAGCYRLDAVRLTAHDTEETRDEISIKYLDVSHRVDMSRGNETTPPDRDFCSNSFDVHLWEWDSGKPWDPHDYLGKGMVAAWQVGNEQHMFFTGHGSNYEFVYNVVPL